MNIAKMGVFGVFLLVLVSSVSAWHCVDNDETATGWSDNNVVMPVGCTGTQGDYVCEDLCDGTTYRDFSCMTRPSHPSETVITWNDEADSLSCKDVPEFSGATALVAAAGVGLVVFAFAKKR